MICHVLLGGGWSRDRGWGDISSLPGNCWKENLAHTMLLINICLIALNLICRQLVN